MTLGDLITLTNRLLAMDLDNFAGESPSNAEVTAQINAALRWVSRYIRLFNPKITFTLTADQAIYSIQSLTVVTQRLIKPTSVTINGTKLYGPDGIQKGIWSYGEFLGRYPNWETDASGTPSRAVVYNEGKVLLHQAPTAAVVSAGSNYIAGYVYAADLDSGTLTGVPDIPEDCHEALACLAAAWAADPQIAADEALQRARRFNDRAFAAMEETRARNTNSAASFNWSAASIEYPDLIR